MDLRPGTYTVTFSLTGFSTLKREGIELTTGFTAIANADLLVGALEETITVSGASPIVDTQNVRSQRVLSRETLDTLPTGKTIQGYGALTLGPGWCPRPARMWAASMAKRRLQIEIHGNRDGEIKLLIALPLVAT